MRMIRPYLVVVFTALLYTTYVITAFGSPLALVTPGSNFSPDEPFHFSEDGYDGQFVYYIARDPLGAAPLIDVPAYRYQRILLPVFGWIAAFGQTLLLPFSLLSINLIALATSTAVLEQMLVKRRVSRWYALGYALALGTLGGVRMSLSEPLAYGLSIIALWFIADRDQLGWGALAFAGAVLAKETTILIAAAYGFHLLFERKILRALGYGALILVPFTLWQITLWRWLGSPGIGSGGANATGFELIPFMGVFRIGIEGGANLLITLSTLLIPFVILPTLWGFWRCWRDFRLNTWSFFTTVLLMSVLIMPFVPFSTYIEINGILRFIVGLQAALILYAAHKRNQRALRYSQLWIITGIIIIYSDILLSRGFA